MEWGSDHCRKVVQKTVRACQLILIGNETTNSVPSAILLLTEMFPQWALAMASARQRPKPVPGLLRLVSQP